MICFSNKDQGARTLISTKGRYPHTKLFPLILEERHTEGEDPRTSQRYNVGPKLHYLRDLVVPGVSATCWNTWGGKGRGAWPAESRAAQPQSFNIALLKEKQSALKILERSPAVGPGGPHILSCY